MTNQSEYDELWKDRDELKAYQEVMIYLLTAEPNGYPLHKWTSEYGYVITVNDIIDVFKRINK